jgi:hypothetical protein
MTNKIEYNIKDTVWIHLGEQSLVKGRVVEIIDLEHLNEGYGRDQELYVIEISTPIEPVYEVRNYEQISPDAEGPLMLFRNLDGIVAANRLLKKVGVKLPGNAAENTLVTDETTESKKFKKRRYYSKRKKY